MIKTEYKIKKLKNGMKVLLVPNKNVDSVDVSVFFRVGSRCEEPQLSGISHFLEHMFFKGTKKRPETKMISEAVDGVGGDMNAFTSYEYTGYYIKVASTNVEVAVDVLADMILNSKFDPKELNRERNVIKEEIKMYDDNPSALVWRLWNQVLYGEQGLGRDVAGVFETVDNVDAKKMIEYRDKYYSIKNALLVVVGNFAEKKMMEMLNKYWKNISIGEMSIFAKTDEQQATPQLRLIKKDINQANFCVGVRTYNSLHQDHFVCQVLSVILGQGMSSRLFINVRERKGLAYSIHANTDHYTDVGNLMVKTGTDIDSVYDALKLILKEFSRLKKEPVEAVELKKAKEYWKGRMILSLEQPETIANIIGMQELIYDKVLTPDEMIKAIEKVSAKDIMRVANDIFANDKLNLAVVGPFGDDEKFRKILKF
ncbi:MAG TPA: pitrilysin family protein [bacterium]|nr:pitrilysin family protein [bacterium]